MTPTSVFSCCQHSISSRTLPKWEQEWRLLRYSLAEGRQFLLGLYRSGSKNDACFGILLLPTFNFFSDFTEVGARMTATSVFSCCQHSISSWTLPKWEQEWRLLRYSLADGRLFLLGLYRSRSKNDACFGIFSLTAGNFFLDFTEVRARMTAASVFSIWRQAFSSWALPKWEHEWRLLR